MNINLLQIACQTSEKGHRIVRNGILMMFIVLTENDLILAYFWLNLYSLMSE